MAIPNIMVTDQAAQRVEHLIALENANDPLRLRIAVSGGGCSGFQYHFVLDSEKTADDQVFEKNGVGFIIDSMSLGLLSDAIIDYTEDLTSSSFVIKNPNATSSCGCGNSFSM